MFTGRKIKKLQEELDKQKKIIQKLCPHNSFTYGFGWAGIPIKTCDLCDVSYMRTREEQRVKATCDVIKNCIEILKREGYLVKKIEGK